jgi:plasmid stabilization system protein ParE
MKRYRVGLSRLADAQVETIQSWWRENRPAAPDMFHQELEAAVQLLETSPLIGKLYPQAPRSGSSAFSDRSIPLPRLLGSRPRVSHGDYPGDLVRGTRKRTTPLKRPRSAVSGCRCSNSGRRRPIRRTQLAYHM